MLLLAVTTSVAILAAGLLTLDEASPPAGRVHHDHGEHDVRCTPIDAMPRSTTGAASATCGASPRH